MIRGVVRSLFVVAVISGTALAGESPVQVVDKPAAAETAAPKTPAPAVKKQKKHKAKRKARKHKKAHRHTKAKAPPKTK